jgi:hypothetical protein
MPHGTARGPHVRLCGQFTAHTARAVKKIENFFFVPFHPSFPPVHGKIEETREMSSSPSGGKVTSAVPPWPKDYHTPVATMDTDKILRGTLTEETRTQKGDTKTCLL